MLFPTRCPGCARVGPAPCSRCIAQMRRATDPGCPSGVDWCRCLLAHEGPARALVGHLKYRNARGSLAWLARAMAPLLDGQTYDALTWAPTTPARRRDRGFDHAELLARRLAVEVGGRCIATLARLPGPPQTGRSLEDRRRGPAFEALAHPDAGNLVVVDDVVTTGATMTQAASALRGAGVCGVGAVAATHPT